MANEEVEDVENTDTYETSSVKGSEKSSDKAAARELAQALSTPGKSVPQPGGWNKRRYYLRSEFEAHNQSDDCWVCVFGRVYDLSSLLAIQKNLEAFPLMDFAGQDVSHWFDQMTGEPRVQVDEETHMLGVYLPQGRYVHVAPLEPTATWKTDFGTPWWRDDKLFVGSLTAKSRVVRIVNTLTGQNDLLEVCCEETLDELIDRYEDYNKHARSYTWKRLGETLSLEKTLEANGIPDERPEYEDLDIDEDYYIPAIFIYYNDDLTIM